MADATEQAAQAVIDRNRSRSIPIPDREWASYQSWDRLLVCHWPIDAALLRPRVPAPLEIDTFDGQAFIGLIPMFMGEIRLRGLGSIPTESQFAELNFRTYVRCGGRAGVYFFHIYAPALLADIGARLFFHTPYELAAVHYDQQNDGGFHFRSNRVLPHRVTFDALFRPKGDPFACAPGSLEAFHSERYSAFAETMTGSIVRGDLIHDPWLIQDVDVDVRENTVLAAAGFSLPASPAYVHYAPGVKTVLWTFEDVMLA